MAAKTRRQSATGVAPPVAEGSWQKKKILSGQTAW
jgi:hypothetical protein